MNIRWVVFDLDDTLYDQLLPFESAIRLTWPNAQEYQIGILFNNMGRYSDLLWIQYGLGAISLEEFRIRRIQLAFDDIGIAITEEDAFLFQQRYAELQNTISLFDDAPKLLQDLLVRGYKLGIITNGPVQHQRNKMKVLGIESFISKDNILISDELGTAKPDPEIFGHYCTNRGLRPEHILYVGDNWLNDVAAPLDAGWNAVFYNYRNKKPSTAHQPNGMILRLAELSRILQ